MKRHLFCVLFLCVAFSLVAQNVRHCLAIGWIMIDGENQRETALAIVDILERQLSATEKFRIKSSVEFRKLGISSEYTSEDQGILKRESIEYFTHAGFSVLETGYELYCSIYDQNYDSVAHSTETFAGNTPRELYTAVSAVVDQLVCQMSQKGITAFAVGDRSPAGGWIFYDKGSYSDGWRYLECAPADLEGIYLGGVWEGRDDTLKVSPETKDGGLHEGLKNAQAVLRFLNDPKLSKYQKEEANGSWGIPLAAKACDEYTFNGYDDWYLPNFREVYAMRALKDKGKGGFSDNTFYQTSTVKPYGLDGYGNWSPGYTGVFCMDDPMEAFRNSFGHINTPGKVRPVRRF